MSKVNVPFAVFSLVTSVLLWASVYNDNKKAPDRDSVRAQLTTKNLDESKYVITDMPTTVNLPLVGYPDQLRKALRQTTTAIIDLTDAVASSKSYPIIVFPAASRELLGNNSILVPIKIEALITKKVDIIVARTGSLQAGLHEESSEPSLRWAYVTGPSSAVQKVASVQATVNLSSINQTPQDEEVESKAVDDKGNTVSRVILHSIDDHPDYKEENINESLKVRVTVRYVPDASPPSAPPSKK